MLFHRTPSCRLRPPAAERRDCCENRSWHCSLPFGTGGSSGGRCPCRSIPTAWASGSRSPTWARPHGGPGPSRRWPAPLPRRERRSAPAPSSLSSASSACSQPVELHGVVHEARAEEAHSAFAARDGDRDGVLPGDEGMRGDIDRELHVVSTVRAPREDRKSTRLNSSH